MIATETGSNQLSNHGLIQLDDGRILLGISHYRDVRPMTGDLDMAIFDIAFGSFRNWSHVAQDIHYANLKIGNFVEPSAVSPGQ